jgi:predicted DCC family thiol-disulfide oxidoreductase YuxK
MRHIVFFDGECGLCDRSVRFLLRIDKNRRLVFAPLQGQTAQTDLVPLYPDAMKMDSLVLLDEGRRKKIIYLRGKGILRILWHIGGWWKILGIFSFLPTIIADFVYRIVAKNRHRLSRPLGVSLESRYSEKELQERFLP